jgi:hypothetical protein
VIVELAKNSLDANAHTVLVSVDFKRGSCIVEDDGEGIRPVEFESGGGLGKAHRMSCLFYIFDLALTSLSQIRQNPKSQRHMAVEAYSWPPLLLCPC